MQDIDTDGFTSILYNYDNTYELNYDDNELTSNDIEILAKCFIDVVENLIIFLYFLSYSFDFFPM